MNNTTTNSGLRQSRKAEHIAKSLELTPSGHTGFCDIQLIHNCLPELSLAQISLGTDLAGLPLASPLMINAITGGSDDVASVNRMLAEVARDTGIAMAVGSQTAAIEDHSVVETYAQVRKINRNGILFANIGAHQSSIEAQQAVDMLEANGLQIHLNVAQELVMREGDRDFHGYRENIAAIAEAVNVPVIVKEVGFGIAYEQAIELSQCGIAALDVGGRGGTNFAAIEQLRLPDTDLSCLQEWGIPTAVSLIEALAGCRGKIDVIASGGVANAFDVVKALAIGATSVAVAGPFLRTLLQHGSKTLCETILLWHEQIKRMMLLCGAKTVQELTAKPIVLTGVTREWLIQRGIPLYRNGHLVQLR